MTTIISTDDINKINYDKDAVKWLLNRSTSDQFFGGMIKVVLQREDWFDDLKKRDKVIEGIGKLSKDDIDKIKDNTEFKWKDLINMMLHNNDVTDVDVDKLVVMLSKNGVLNENLHDLLDMKLPIAAVARNLTKLLTFSAIYPSIPRDKMAKFKIASLYIKALSETSDGLKLLRNFLDYKDVTLMTCIEHLTDDTKWLRSYLLNQTILDASDRSVDFSVEMFKNEMYVELSVRNSELQQELIRLKTVSINEKKDVSDKDEKKDKKDTSKK